MIDYKGFEDYLRKQIILKFSRSIINQYEDKVNNYFLNRGKEIRYMFLFDFKKNDELNKLIKNEDKQYRKLELELLKLGLGYNLKDIEKYSKIIDTENIKMYEKIEITSNGFDVYNQIKFENENIIKKSKNYEDLLINSKNYDKKNFFNKYVKFIKDNNLSKYYKIIKKEYIIELKIKKLNDIINLIKKSEENKKLFSFFIYENVKTKNIKVYDNKNVDIKKYLIYYKVGDKFLNHNKESYNKYYKDNSKIFENVYGVFIKGLRDFGKTTFYNKNFFELTYYYINAGLKKIINKNENYEIYNFNSNKCNINLEIKKDFNIKFNDELNKDVFPKIEKMIGKRLKLYMNMEIKEINK